MYKETSLGPKITRSEFIFLQNFNCKFKIFGFIDDQAYFFMGFGIHFTKLSVIENLYTFFYIVIFLFEILYFAPPPLGAPGGGAKFEL